MNTGFAAAAERGAASLWQLHSCQIVYKMKYWSIFMYEFNSL